MEPGDQVRGVAVHEESDHDGRGDDRSAPAIPEQQTQHQRQERRPKTTTTSGRSTWLGFVSPRFCDQRNSTAYAANSSGCSAAKRLGLVASPVVARVVRGVLQSALGRGRWNDRRWPGWHHREVSARSALPSDLRELGRSVLPDRARHPRRGRPADAPVRARRPRGGRRRRDPSRCPGPLGVGRADPGGGRADLGPARAARRGPGRRRLREHHVAAGRVAPRRGRPRAGRAGHPRRPSFTRDRSTSCCAGHGGRRSSSRSSGRSSSGRWACSSGRRSHDRSSGRSRSTSAISGSSSRRCSSRSPTASPRSWPIAARS